ncbi:MAG: hypothetical protein KC417_17565 [Myxococcales bacterium]|nr:hypothetical protein [Myxococcales bacterium]
MSLEIRELRPGNDVRTFLDAARVVYRNDPAWVPPLDMDMKDRLNPKKNPFFEHGEVGLFTAWRDGRLVGRCSTSIDHEHLRIHKDDTGFFGFFDTLDDPEAAKALMDSARQWTKARGLKRIRGPISLNSNEEIGTLIEGFEHPPVLMMPHARPYQAELIAQTGVEKVKDLYAWRFEVGTLNARVERAWKQVQEMPEVRLRSVNKKNMEQELRTIMEIFNEAWKDNWGFVPATPSEMKKAAADMKLIIDEDMAFIAEIDGRAVGMCICLPNLNEAIRDIDGKLFPTGLAKMLWRTKVAGLKSARLMLLGIRSELRGVKKYGALSTAIYVEIAKRGAAKGYQWGELSWTLEDNHPVNLGIKAMGAKIYKKYRVFEGTVA